MYLVPATRGPTKRAPNTMSTIERMKRTIMVRVTQMQCIVNLVQHANKMPTIVRAIMMPPRSTTGFCSSISDGNSPPESFLA